MSYLNNDVVQQMVSALDAGEFASLHNFWTEDIVFHMPGQNPLSGDYEGVPNVLRACSLIQRHMHRHPMSITILTTSSSQSHVAVRFEGKAEANGKPLVWRAKALFFFRGSEVAACWLFADDQTPFDAYWSAGARPTTSSSGLNLGLGWPGWAGA